MGKQVQQDTKRELLRAKPLIRDGIRSLPDDKEGGLRVGEKLLSRKHAVKWALIGVCLGSAMGVLGVDPESSGSLTPFPLFPS